MAERRRRRLPAATRLRLLLLVLFAAIVLPSAVLVHSTWRQLKWESFHQARSGAEELGGRIDAELQRLLAIEEQRAAADYNFVRISGQPGVSNLLERSPLAAFPVQSEMPGLLGWFQIDGLGVFSTPLLPVNTDRNASFGLDASEQQRRAQLQQQLFEVLQKNQLTVADASSAKRLQLSADQKKSVTPARESGSTPATAPDTRESEEFAVVDEDRVQTQQLAFDQLQSRGRVDNALARVDELKLKQNYQNEVLQQRQAPNVEVQEVLKDQSTRAPRKEQSASVEGYAFNELDKGVEPGETVSADSSASTQALTEPVANAIAPLAKLEARKLSIFETELEPFEFSLLGDGHALLYRKVWQGGQRLVQGALLQQEQLLADTVSNPFAQTSLAGFSDLLIAWRGDVVQLNRSKNPDAGFSAGASATDLQGELLYQQRLSAPFDEFQLLWHLRELPPGPGASLLLWTTLVLAAILIGSFFLLHQLGLRQLKLGQQRQDFVAAVSHELNTPLTSIRMYAEMLKAGWADPAKQHSYYEFIHAESERLSRLISNVLQLARLERNERPLDHKHSSAAALFDMLKSRTSSQIQRAGFELKSELAPGLEDAAWQLEVDADAIVQIVINLVDNALKFAAHSQPQQIDLSMSLRPGSQPQLAIRVRDYGPGINPDQIHKIFDLFYRSSDTRTRETPGTGIGLALVRQLARAHGGEASVRNAEPGAEFELVLPVAKRL